MARQSICRGARELTASLALILTTSAVVISQDAFDATLAVLPGELRDVKSAGRWRTADAEGVYRVVVLRVGYEHIADRLYVQWVRSGIDDQPPRVIGTVSVNEINEAGPFTVSHALQAEATSRLRIVVNARHTYTRQPRQFVFFATAPGVYTTQRPPSSAGPKRKP